MIPFHLERHPAPAPQAREVPPPVLVVPQAEPEPAIPSELAELFSETDPLLINRSIFDELAADVDMPVTDVCFSLPRVFDRRHFQILNFEDTEVRGVMDLRGEDFYGFYLAELPHHGLDLVYACRGVHIEWGMDKCVLQPALRAEPAEYGGHGLLGLAQHPDGGFLFIVEPDYMAWVRPHQLVCAQANAKFATLREFARVWRECTLIWPAGVLEPSSG